MKESKPKTEEANEPVAPEIIVAPEEEADYNEEFEASGAVENKAKEEIK